MLVTIVVPVYKVEKFIDRCVESLINQTYRNLQIIIVDDGSPDNCGIICDNYSKLDSRIEVIHKRNGGLSESRNDGIKAAKGKYILFIDSDDYIEYDAVKKLINYAETYQLDILSANALKIMECKKEKLINLQSICDKGMTGEEYMSYCISHGNFSAAVCTRLYRTDLIKNNQIYFVKDLLHEDENWMPKILLKTKCIMQIDYCFYNYVIRENSITQSVNKEKNIISIIKTCEELEGIYNKEQLSDGNRKLFLDYLARLYMATSTLGNYNKSFYLFNIDKNFIKRNIFLRSTKIKYLLFRLNINLYRLIKRIFG